MCTLQGNFGAIDRKLAHLADLRVRATIMGYHRGHQGTGRQTVRRIQEYANIYRNLDDMPVKAQ
jgi:hypothetical protein